MPIDVSVIVTTYNSGPFVEPCIEGYLNQTMPADRREVIFCDDGSTDDTPERLDRLAAEHPNVSVHHLPHSGWPGGPRNVGIDHARGDYVFFHDHDDWLGAEALERLVGTARRTDADIVLGKIVGHGRNFPRAPFSVNVDHATLASHRLMHALTAHKLFRRDLLNQHELRFPEGVVRLEDQRFVVQAYFAARNVAIIADYACYHRGALPTGRNIARAPFEPADYYRSLRSLIATIIENTEPGPLRDRLLMRPFLTEMLGRLTEPRMLRWEPAFRDKLFAAIHELALDCFSPTFHEALDPVDRARAATVRAGRSDLTLAIAEAAAAVSGAPTCTRLPASGDGWTMSIENSFMHADGSPLRLSAAGEEWRIDPRLLPDGVATTVTSKEATTSWHRVLLRHRTTNEEWQLPHDLRATLQPDGDEATILVAGTAGFDPATAAAGRPLPEGIWDVTVRTGLLGLTRQRRLAAAAITDSLPEPIRFGSPTLVATPFVTPNGNLSVRVRTAARPASPGRRTGVVRRTVGRLRRRLSG